VLLGAGGGAWTAWDCDDWCNPLHDVVKHESSIALKYRCGRCNTVDWAWYASKDCYRKIDQTRLIP